MLLASTTHAITMPHLCQILVDAIRDVLRPPALLKIIFEQRVCLTHKPESMSSEGVGFHSCQEDSKFWLEMSSAYQQAGVKLIVKRNNGKSVLAQGEEFLDGLCCSGQA